jgi:ATP-dependent RNA helicase RhlE
MTFEDLNLTKPLLSALKDLEYLDATPIQEKVFPLVMSGRDVIGIAQTGTGKTFAYLLPILRQLKFSDQKNPRVLIVVPTRELVLQIVGEIEKLCKYMHVRSLGVYGGTNINTQKQLVYNGVDILVATPGRLVDLKLTGILKLKEIQKLVIDEVDEMLNLGFRTQVINLLDILPKKRQNLMFSATLTSDVEKLFAEHFNGPVKVEIAPRGTPLDKLIQGAYRVPNFMTKANLLVRLLETEKDFSKVLVFVKSKKLADSLFEELESKMPGQFGVIHSNKSQVQRFAAVKNFNEGKFPCLIATDIIARGLDFSDVSHVINFDLPDMPGDYIHRIGRTGRANKAGIAMSFISEPEVIYLEAIEELIGKPIPMLALPEGLVISNVYSDEERPALGDKNYLQNKGKQKTGAFHEKLDKNKKVNLGGLRRRQGFKEKKKRKPVVRSARKRT